MDNVKVHDSSLHVIPPSLAAVGVGGAQAQAAGTTSNKEEAAQEFFKITRVDPSQRSHDTSAQNRRRLDVSPWAF